MRTLEIYQVDVFARENFNGNPLAVVILEEELDDSLLQKIAAEMNLSETAFISYIDRGIYRLRWFTPITEVDLCGHGTIGSAKILMEKEGLKRLVFKSNSGDIEVEKVKEGIRIDFPLDELEDIDLGDDLLKALGLKEYIDVKIGKNTGKIIIEVDGLETIENLRPNFQELKNIRAAYPLKGLGVTTKGDSSYDFYSRYFNPWGGINEDPVTGSVHTVLGNYWSRKLKKEKFLAYQASHRPGQLHLIVAGDRIDIIGDARLILRGELYLD